MVCTGDFGVLELSTEQLTNLSLLGVAGSFGQVSTTRRGAAAMTFHLRFRVRG